jgi:hypothetical protein
MTMSIRHFLVDHDEVRPLTQSVNDRLRRGEARLPRYAGRDLHIVDVTVELDNRTPVKVRGVQSATVSLDERGAVRSRLLADLKASLATTATTRSRRSAERSRWSPSKAQLKQIEALALGRMKTLLRSPRAAESPAPRSRRHADGAVRQH